MPTKQSKKLDQLFLSRAEIKKNEQGAALKALVGYAQDSFLFDAKQEFGALWVRRLKASAKRAGCSPLGYVAEVLLK